VNVYKYIFSKSWEYIRCDGTTVFNLKEWNDNPPTYSMGDICFCKVFSLHLNLIFASDEKYEFYSLSVLSNADISKIVKHIKEIDG
jgi:hypothetical protein